jgi:hypothetical protein
VSGYKLKSKVAVGEGVWGDTHMMFSAVDGNNTELVEESLHSGADMHTVDKHSWTELMHCVQGAHRSGAASAQRQRCKLQHRRFLESALPLSFSVELHAQIDTDVNKGFSTDCFQYTCQAGSCYKIRMLQLLGFQQFGFATSKL